MKVRNGFMFAIAVLLTLPLGYFLIDRIDFVRSSQQAAGTVEHISATNDRCGRKRSRHNCTRFRATLRYRVDAAEYRIRAPAGRARGHNQPISRSDYRIGSPVPVAYDPRRPYRAYRDTFWDIWGAPVFTFIFQICAFFGGFAEKRRRN